MSKKADTPLQKTWHFLWHDDSWQALVVNILVAFLLIKYVLYPGIGLLFGTPLPIVAVVSGSMEHHPQNGVLCGKQVDEQNSWWDACGEWYEQKGISQEEFSDYPFSKGFNKGDIMVLFGVETGEVEVGDVIVYQANRDYPLIHRVVNISEDEQGIFFGTKGDHNPQQIVDYALSAGGYLYRCYREEQGIIIASSCAVGTAVGPDTPNAIPLLDETNVRSEHVIGRAALRVPAFGYVKIWFVEFLDAIGLSRLSQLF